MYDWIRNYYEDVKDEWIDWKQELGKRIDGEKEPYSDGIGFEILLNQAWIDRRKNSKSLAWSSVLKAFEKTEGKPVVSRPKALEDIRGVSYLYGIFYKFGLIDIPDDLLKKYQK